MEGVQVQKEGHQDLQEVRLVKQAKLPLGLDCLGSVQQEKQRLGLDCLGSVVEMIAEVVLVEVVVLQNY